MSKPEEIVMLIADTGTEASCFEDCLGKDDLRKFDAVFLQCGIEILNSQFLIIYFHIIIYESTLKSGIIDFLIVP